VGGVVVGVVGTLDACAELVGGALVVGTALVGAGVVPDGPPCPAAAAAQTVAACWATARSWSSCCCAARTACCACFTAVTDAAAADEAADVEAADDPAELRPADPPDGDPADDPAEDPADDPVEDPDDVADGGVVAVWLSWSAANVCCAWARVACALLTCCCSAEPSRVARVCPALTVAPSCAWTVETVPLTGNDRTTLLAELIVPTEDTVWVTDPTVAVASR
jgi:hypothetical protein